MLIQGYHPRQIKYDRKLRDIAVSFRDAPTPTEQILWQELKAKRLGYKFRRQHPLHGYIVDFYCYELMLVIEVDGPIHDQRIEHDKNKDEILNKNGYRVMRFKNDEIIYSLRSVVEKILSYTHPPFLNRKGARG